MSRDRYRGRKEVRLLAAANFLAKGGNQDTREETKMYLHGKKCAKRQARPKPIVSHWPATKSKILRIVEGGFSSSGSFFSFGDSADTAPGLLVSPSAAAMAERQGS